MSTTYANHRPGKIETMSNPTSWMSMKPPCRLTSEVARQVAQQNGVASVPTAAHPRSTYASEVLGSLSTIELTTMPSLPCRGLSSARDLGSSSLDSCLFLGDTFENHGLRCIVFERQRLRRRFIDDLRRQGR